MKACIKYSSRAVRNTNRVSVEDTFLVVSFRTKVKRALDESATVLGNRRIPGAHRAHILAGVVTFVSTTVVAVVVWAPLPRAHLMVSLVTGMASWLTAAGFGSHPHG